MGGRGRRSRRSASAVAVVLALVLGACAAADAGGSDERPLLTANGIVWRDGHLWVTSLFTNRIVEVDPGTGAILTNLDADQSVDGVDDLAFGPSGALFTTAPTAARVLRRDPDGSVVELARLPGANGIRFAPDGRLFVGRQNSGTGLVEVDPDGVGEVRYLRSHGGPLNAFDFGPDGLLYGPTFTDGQVIAVDVDADTRRVVADGLILPSAARFTPAGELVVLQSAFPARLLTVDPATGAVAERARVPFDLADNFAVAPDGTIYVTNFVDGVVGALAPDGSWRLIRIAG